MELEAREADPRPETSRPDSRHTRDPSLSTYMRPNQHTQDAAPPSKSDEMDTSQRQRGDIQAYRDADRSADQYHTMTSSAPSFSPFPKVKGDTIPPSDDEKEEILWNARKHVLGSQNVSMQITWARDVLNWAEIISEAAARDSPDYPRPSTPRVEHELRVDAINIITYLSGQEHPQALYIKAKWFEFGKFGSRIDKREAYTGYKKAADLGNARSEYRIGMLYEQSNDTSRAKEHYYKGMGQRDSAALYRMGMMSLLGQLGEAKDYHTGLERIQAAADSADEDSPQGAFVYGMLVGRELPDIYIPDSMLPNSSAIAKKYVEKSAYLGFAKAQHKMGQAYELCQFGCEFNPSYSLHYYGLAANQGNAEAALGVSRWFLFGYEGVFKKNEELAFKYAQHASNAKLATGQFAMGYYHEIGIHVEKNVSEARRWYRIAAENGNGDAKGRLDSLSQDQALSKEDHETTTLTRIKSQHGSQKGKRPDRFKQPAQQMPTLSEGGHAQGPPNEVRPLKLNKPDGPSPRASPQPSPGLRPTVVEHSNFPDPSRASIVVSDRPPAASNARLDTHSTPPMRPQSAAPYPEDDRTLPIHGGRPKSTAPYPEDDVQGRLMHDGRRSHLAGPPADRPGSAFGINTQGHGPGSRPMPHSQSAGNLQLHPQGPHTDPRGRIASAGPQNMGGAYRQPSPGPISPTGNQFGRDQGYGRPTSAQQYPPPNHGPGRMSKPPPESNYPPSHGDPQSPYSSNRPSSAAPPAHVDPRFGRVPGAGLRPDRHSALPQHDLRQPRIPADAPRPPLGPAGAPGPAPGPALAPAPAPGPGPGPGSYPAMGPGRVGSAPPSQMQRPDPKPSPGPSVSSAASAPVKPSKGPATFEDMGIPQGKQEGDCVSESRVNINESLANIAGQVVM